MLPSRRGVGRALLCAGDCAFVLGGDVKEKPILFSGEMIRALLSGAKTQTRRVMKPQPATDLSWVTGWGWTFFTPEKHISGRGIHPVKGASEVFLPCPYFLGQRLWVRETWAALHPGTDLAFSKVKPRPGVCSLAYKATEERGINGNWRPSIFMPRWASRITLEVTEVRVERVNDISEEDAIAEGLAIWLDNEGRHTHYGINRADVWERDPRLTFRRLWDGINAKRGYPFDSGVWVWAIAFKRVKP